MKLNFIHSIKAKLIILISVMSLSSLLIVSTVFYYFVYEVSTEQAKDSIANETKLISLRFGELFRIIQNDVSMLLRTPPIQGIIRSKKNNGVDLIGKSTFEQWQERLSNIFLAVMQNNDSYMQARYIGIENNGKEIVRVNRILDNAESFEVVPNNELQEKNKESYFVDGLKLKKNDIYISNVTYNRENGKVTDDYTAMIRVIVPVYDNNMLFGFIVINVDYPSFFKKITKELAPSTNLIIINNDGSYFEFDYENNNYIFSNYESDRYQPTKYIKYAQELKSNIGNYIDKESYTYYIKNQVSSNNAGGLQYFFTALQTKNSSLFAKSNHLVKSIIILMIFIITLKLLAGYIFANRLINPLSKITNELRNYNHTRGRYLQECIDRNDEIGSLAKTFKELLNEIEQFVYTSSHDLKQPLRNIATYISFLKLDCYNLMDSKGLNYLSSLEKSVQRMHTLISELLNYSRIGYDKVKNKVDLNGVLKDVLDDLDSAIKSCNAIVNYDDLPKVIGVKTDLHSLFQNLIDNSIKYRKKDIRLNIFITVENTLNNYIIKIIDNGVGIDNLYHERVFDLFHRGSEFDNCDGTGIGLAHCKKIVEQHHGSIKLKSEKDKGCTFIIIIPNSKNI